MKKFKKGYVQFMLSLMTKLFLAGVLLSVLPLLIYQYISFEQSSKTLQLTYAKELKHKTELTTLVIDQAISHRESDLNTVVHSVHEWLSLKDVKSLSKYFNSFTSHKYDINSLSLIDNNGKIVLSTSSSAKKSSLNINKCLDEYKESKYQRNIVSELIYDNSEAYIYMFEKVENYEYYVMLEINVRNIEFLLSNFDDEVAGKKPVLVVDKQNNIILSTDKSYLLNKRYKDIEKFNKDNGLDEKIFYFKDSDGEDVIATYDELSSFGINDALGWRVIASIPISVINQDVSRSLEPMKQIGIITILMTILILTILARTIVKSIKKVVHVANKISTGDYSARIVDKSTTREFHSLSKALNTMADKIQSRTDQLQTQKQLLENLAHYDNLTQIPNRVLFKNRIKNSIETAKLHKTKFALCYIDLDEFKHINDSYGHDIGDEVLKIVAIRVLSILKDGDTFARIGGDEFTIILEDLQSLDYARDIAEKIIYTIKQPMDIEGNIFKVSTSIGISVYPDDATEKSNLIKYSDIAMYKAKSLGKDNYQFYNKDMINYSYIRVKMEQNIDFAIKNKEFEVYYQPQIDATTNKHIGMEALIRWKHAKDGYISPIDFLPLAEEIGVIIEIDQWVMKTAMKQMVIWNEQGYDPGVMALNLSIRHLQRDSYITILKDALKETGCKPQWIELEVTESQIMSNYNESIVKLKEINSMGIKIAIDDFGTGYSSLSHLKHLPIDKLKIDKSFVDDIPENEEDVAIVKAIIALGESLNLTVLAEGVETKEQSKCLVENGCHNIQGFLYGKPQSSKDLEKNFLKK